MSTPAATSATVLDIRPPEPAILRGQLINAVELAARLFEKHNAGVALALRYARVDDTSIVFTVSCEQFGTRLYSLAVTAPDGSSLNLSRWNDAGERIGFEPFDHAYLQACAATVPATVGVAFGRTAPLPKAPTHPPVTTLQ